MRLLQLAFRNVRRQKWSFFLSGIVLSMASMALALALGYLGDVRQRIDFVQNNDLYRAGLLWLTPAHEHDLSPDALGETWNTVVSAVRAHPGVSAVGYVQGVGVVPGNEPSHDPLDGLLINADYALGLPPPPIPEGRWFADGDWGDQDAAVPVVLNAHLQDRLKLHDTFQWMLPWETTGRTVTLSVVGFFSDAGFLFGTSAPHLEALLPRAGDVDILIPLRSSFALPVGWVPGLVVTADSEDSLIRLQADLAALDPNGTGLAGIPGVDVSLTTVREMAKAYQVRTRQPLVVSTWFTLVVLSLTVFGYGSMNALRIQDRKPELGVHFACGATRWTLVALILLETLLPLALPLALGVVAGVAVQWVETPLAHYLNGSTIGISAALLLAITGACGAAPVLLVGRTPPVNLLTSRDLE